MQERVAIRVTLEAEEKVAAARFAPFSARRILLVGGILLALGGMVFGEVFAIFHIHPIAGEMGNHLTAAVQAVAQDDPATVESHFAEIGSLQEYRGTKLDTHVHVIKLAYLALILALVQPFVRLSPGAKVWMAIFVVVGSLLGSIFIYSIYHIGVWGSIGADTFLFLVIVGAVGELIGIRRYLREGSKKEEDPVLHTSSPSGHLLLAGGLALILIGFLHGLFYAVVALYPHEAAEGEILTRALTLAVAGNVPGAEAAVAEYGGLQANVAVNIAAHTHFIEFGFLAMLLAFIQRYVLLREKWKLIWSGCVLVGSFFLPLFVWLEIYLGLFAGGLADAAGFVGIAGLAGMLAGVWRYTGAIDAVQESAV